MNFVRTVLAVLLPLLVLALGAGLAYAMVQASKRPPAEPPPKVLPLVEVVPVAVTTWEPIVPATGSVTPAISGELVSEVQGRILEIGDGLRVGARFAAGAVLLRIDPRDYQLAVAEAEAAVAQARVAVEVERAEAEAAIRAWRDLHGADEPPPLVRREPQAAEVAARLSAARTRLETARRDLDRTTILAPYDGFTYQRHVEHGQFVSRGTRLAQLFGSARAEVRLPIVQDDLALLDLATSTVTLRGEVAGKEQTWQGKVARREDWLDPKTRMAGVVVEIDNPFVESPESAAMFLNLFVRAELHGREVSDVVVLPRKALRGPSRVYVIDQDNRLHFREVRVIHRAREHVVIADGLQAGERVCITPLDLATEGMGVRVGSGEIGSAR
ncbi:MAG: efflux RND transporter periplasmic adaptor subunit [Planctomycetota bacterium]